MADEQKGGMSPSADPVLLVDFDGVLHPVGCEDKFCLSERFARFHARLEGLMGRKVHVAVSSSWRTELRKADGSFDGEIAADMMCLDHSRVVGCTPELGFELRGQEAEAFMAAGRSGAPWVFIDDITGIFAGIDWAPRALFVDPAKGIGDPEPMAFAVLGLLAAQSQDAAGTVRGLEGFSAWASSGDGAQEGVVRAFGHVCFEACRQGWLGAGECSALAWDAGYPGLGAMLHKFGDGAARGRYAERLLAELERPGPAAFDPQRLAAALSELDDQQPGLAHGFAERLLRLPALGEALEAQVSQVSQECQESPGAWHALAKRLSGAGGARPRLR